MKAKHRPCCYAKTVQGFDCSRLFYVRSRRKKNGLSLAHQVNTYTVVKKIEITKKKSTNVTESKMTEIALHHM